MNDARPCVPQTLGAAGARDARPVFVWVCRLATFTSAFLLFQVQPLVAKSLLPWFGGSPAVWTTSMMFFQGMLVLGYAYAGLQARAGGRGPALIHGLLLAAAAASVPIRPDPELAAFAGELPQLRVLLLLLATVGLPFFVLASTAPLLQAWFARAAAGASPYPLYALSNAGSLLSLLTFPFVFEPRFSTHTLWSAWSLALLALAAALAYLTYAQQRLPAPARVARRAHAGRVRPSWIALPALASAMLLIVTDRITTDVAVVPFLWIAPLAVYLTTFILAFAERRYYFPRAMGAIAALLLLALPLLMIAPSALAVYAEAGVRLELPTLYDSAALTTAVCLLLLFFVCMVCHGEVVRSKPPPEDLAAFYLAIAAGGALGGLFVSVIAPRVFDGYHELHVGLLASYALAVYVSTRGAARARTLRVWALAPALPLIGLAFVEDRMAGAPAVARARNFYGVVSVAEHFATVPELAGRALYHGAVRHGYQLAHAPLRPTTYYTESSGVGLLLGRHPRRGALRVGAIGLGIGTIASYAAPGDRYRFYEINPLVIELARKHFSYLSQSAGAIELVQGDARQVLQREPDQHFDVLVVDAFSGDSIPVHLLTRECMQVYLRHLAPGGVLAFHVSNRYLDLIPVVLGLGARHALIPALIVQRQTRDLTVTSSQWVLLGRGRWLRDRPDIARASTPLRVQTAALPLWTDDFSDLASRLR